MVFWWVAKWVEFQCLSQRCFKKSRKWNTATYPIRKETILLFRVFCQRLRQWIVTRRYVSTVSARTTAACCGHECSLTPQSRRSGRVHGWRLLLDCKKERLVLCDVSFDRRSARATWSPHRSLARARKSRCISTGRERVEFEKVGEGVQGGQLKRPHY